MFQGNRVEQADIDAAIKQTVYTVLPNTTITLCVLTLDNGFTVLGKAACVDPKNFDRVIGECYALQDAKSKLWPLLGFRLADKMWSDKTSTP